MSYAYGLGLRVVVDLKGFIFNDTALIESVLRFRSHPALLAYYLADEPDGWGLSPASVTVRVQFATPVRTLLTIT